MFGFVFRSFGRRILHALMLLVVTFALPIVAQATSYTFTEGSFNQGFGTDDPRRNRNWHNEFNWEPQGIPSAGDSATIPVGFLVFLDKPTTVQNLTMASGDGNAPDIRTSPTNSLTVTGLLNWSEGTIGFDNPGSLIIPTGATVNLLGPDDKSFHGLLNNAGTINWSGTGRFSVGGSSIVNNAGLMNITATAAYFGKVEGPGAALNNSGTIRRSAGTGLFSIAGFDAARTDSLRGFLNNSGSIEVQSGTFQFHGGLSSGTFNVSTGATIQCADSHKFDGNTISGAGTFRVSGSGEANGTITRNGGPLEIIGGGLRGGFSDVADSTAKLSGNGKLLWKNGYMPGSWTFDTGFRIEASTDGSKGFDGSMLNKGTFLWMGGGALASSQTTFVNEGTFTCTTPGLFLRDTYIFGTHFENRGTFNSAPNGENRTDDAGFSNSGTVNIGGSGVGILRIYYAYTQTATGKLRVDIGGADAAVPQFDQLKMGQGATLAGALNVNFINGFSPPADAVFRIISKSGGSGTFSNVTAQNLSGKTIVANYPNEAVDLVVQNINLSINDASILEGNTGTSTLNFTVSLSAPASQAVAVNYATSSGTALQPDYTSRSGTLTIPAGLIKGVISVPIVGDTLDEADESFFLTLNTPNGAILSDNQGRATIIDNDATPTLTISDAIATEGHSGTTNATFTVTLSAPSGRNVSVNAITANGTAKSPADYTASGASLLFAPGQTSKTFSVPVKGDAIDEEDELFYTLLSSPANASISRARGTCAIADDDAPPTVSITGMLIKEYNAGQTTASFVLSLSAPSGKAVKVSYVTSNGTAIAGSDYVAVAPTQVSFNAGSTRAYARVLINGDDVYEDNDSINVNLSSPVNALMATSHAIGTIINDDAKPSLSINDVSIAEGNTGTKQLTFTVALSKASGLEAAVDFSTANGTAVSAGDYVAKNGRVTFTPGSALTQTINITINGDALVENDETLFVFLSSPSNVNISKARGVGTITNDDTSE